MTYDLLSLSLLLLLLSSSWFQHTGQMNHTFHTSRTRSQVSGAPARYYCLLYNKYLRIYLRIHLFAHVFTIIYYSLSLLLLLLLILILLLLLLSLLWLWLLSMPLPGERGPAAHRCPPPTAARGAAPPTPTPEIYLIQFTSPLDMICLQ